MKRVTYRGPAHILRVGDRELRRGEPDEISNELYDRLSRDPSIRLELLEPDPAEQAASDDADNGEEESD